MVRNATFLVIVICLTEGKIASYCMCGWSHTYSGNSRAAT